MSENKTLNLSTWAETPEEYFDEEQYYKDEIKPLLLHVKALCEQRDIGLFILLNYANREHTLGLSTLNVLPSTGRLSPEHLMCALVAAAPTFMVVKRCVEEVAQASLQRMKIVVN